MSIELLSSESSNEKAPAADGANKGETFFDLEMPLTPEEDREKDFEHLISKYQKLLTKYNVHTDGKCFHKESW